MDEYNRTEARKVAKVEKVKVTAEAHFFVTVNAFKIAERVLNLWYRIA